jgi:CheY-specific phosphatase CheX
MDSDKLKTSLISAVINTLSDMAFLDVSVINKNYESEINENILKIIVLEPVYGKIYLNLPDKTKKIIISNIYGNDEKLTTSEEEDGILEVLNVITGNFMLEYFGKDQIYKIDFPTLLVNNDKMNNNIEYIDFDIDNNNFRLTYEFTKI